MGGVRPVCKDGGREANIIITIIIDMNCYKLELQLIIIFAVNQSAV